MATSQWKCSVEGTISKTADRYGSNVRLGGKSIQIEVDFPTLQSFRRELFTFLVSNDCGLPPDARPALWLEDLPVNVTAILGEFLTALLPGAAPGEVAGGLRTISKAVETHPSSYLLVQEQLRNVDLTSITGLSDRIRSLGTLHRGFFSNVFAPIVASAPDGTEWESLVTLWENRGFPEGRLNLADVLCFWFGQHDDQANRAAPVLRRLEEALDRLAATASRQGDEAVEARSLAWSVMFTAIRKGTSLQDEAAEVSRKADRALLLRRHLVGVKPYSELSLSIVLLISGGADHDRAAPDAGDRKLYEALNLLRSIGQDRVMLDIHRVLAINSKAPDAFLNIKQVALLARKFGEDAMLAEALQALSVSDQDFFFNAGAVSGLKESSALFRKLGNNAAYVQTILQSASKACKSGFLNSQPARDAACRQALEDAETVLVHLESNSDHTQLLEALTFLVNSFADLREYSTAERYSRRLIRVFGQLKQLNSVPGRTAKLSLCRILFETGQVEEALTLGEEIRRMAPGMLNPRDLQRLAEAALLRGYLGEADNYVDRAIQLSLEFEHWGDDARKLLPLKAAIKLQEGNMDEALRLLSIAIAGAGGLNPGLGNHFHLLSKIEERRGRKRLALFLRDIEILTAEQGCREDTLEVLIDQRVHAPCGDRRSALVALSTDLIRSNALLQAYNVARSDLARLRPRPTRGYEAEGSIARNPPALQPSELVVWKELLVWLQTQSASSLELHGKVPDQHLAWNTLQSQTADRVRAYNQWSEKADRLLQGVPYRANRLVPPPSGTAEITLLSEGEEIFWLVSANSTLTAFTHTLQPARLRELTDSWYRSFASSSESRTLGMQLYATLIPDGLKQYLESSKPHTIRWRVPEEWEDLPFAAFHNGTNFWAEVAAHTINPIGALLQPDSTRREPVPAEVSSLLGGAATGPRVVYEGSVAGPQSLRPADWPSNLDEDHETGVAFLGGAASLHTLGRGADGGSPRNSGFVDIPMKARRLAIETPNAEAAAPNQSALSFLDTARTLNFSWILVPMVQNMDAAMLADFRSALRATYQQNSAETFEQHVNRAQRELLYVEGRLQPPQRWLPYRIYGR